MNSYPFSNDQPYARHQWYIAAWGYEVDRTPLTRTILGEEIVLFRKLCGELVALSSHCPHRWMPLGSGEIIGDNIRCSYHGAVFNSEGQCVAIPSQERIPPSLTLRSYLVTERGPCVWIWLGDPERAKGRNPPEVDQALGLGLQGWRNDLVSPIRLRARSQLLIENLFDDSHIGCVHALTLGATDNVSSQSQVIIDTLDRFCLARSLPITLMDQDVQQLFLAPPGRMTSELRIEMFGVAIVTNIGSETYAVDEHGSRTGRLGRMNFVHGITPESPTSTHYFTASTRDFAVTDDALSETISCHNARIVQEDVAILEALETGVARFGDVRREVTFASDSAAMRVRRRMMQTIDRDAL